MKAAKDSKASRTMALYCGACRKRIDPPVQRCPHCGEAENFIVGRLVKS